LAKKVLTSMQTYEILRGNYRMDQVIPLIPKKPLLRQGNPDSDSKSKGCLGNERR